MMSLCHRPFVAACCLLLLGLGLAPTVAAAQGQPTGDPFLVEDFGAEGPDAFEEFAGLFQSWEVDGRLGVSLERNPEGLAESSVLWATDGTAEGSGTIAELARLRLGPLQAGVPSFGLLQSQRDGENLLWRSDGTTAGTRVVSELPGTVLASARLGDRALLAVDVFVRFGRGPVYEEGLGEGLWVTDGTAAGTRQLVDMPADSLGLGDAVRVGDRLAFPAGDPTARVWASDGTAAGTAPVPQSPEVLTWYTEATDGQVTLLRGRDADGVQLFFTDGTAAGTRPAIDLAGAAAVRLLDEPTYDADADRFVALLARGQEPYALWSLRPGAAAERLADVPPLTADDFPFLDAHGGSIYLILAAANDGRELYTVADGQLRLLLATDSGRSFLVLGTLDDRRLLLDVQAEEGEHELWATDGTVGGTGPIATVCTPDCGGFFVFEDLYVSDVGDRLLIHRSAPDGPYDLFLVTAGGATNLTVFSDPELEVRQILGEVDGLVVFRVTDDSAARRPGRFWVTDGTPGGTRPLPAPNVPERSDLSIVDTARVGDSVAFVERREDPGIQARFDLGYEPAGTHVWISDGTADGTREVYAAPFDEEDGWSRIFDLVHQEGGAQGDRALFVVLPGELRSGEGGQARVLSVDDDGAVRVLYTRSADPAVDTAPGRFYLVKSGDRVYLKESEGFRLLEPGADSFGPLVPLIWVRDGIVREGLRREEDNSLPVPLPSGDDLFLTSGTAFQRWSLVVTDGTPEGTERLEDRQGRAHDLVRVGGRAWFVASAFNRALPRVWVSDGTVAGTGPAGLFPEPPHRIDQLHAAGGRLYIETETAIAIADGTRELWASDGTQAGTRKVLDGRPVFRSVDFRGRLLFVASDGDVGRELWISNGTVAGTRPVLDLVPGPTPSLPADLTVAGSFAYFTAFTPERGRELWVTDGTAAGTRRLSDLDPGPAASDPMHLVPVDDLLFFEADDGAVGRELFALPITSIDGDGGGEPGGEIPPRPNTEPLTSPQVPGFRFWVEITPQGQAPLVGAAEPACIPETLCVSGALAGRTEVFLRVIGPRPNGLLWPVVTRFTPSRVEVWIEQASTGDLRYYDLPATDPDQGDLSGLFDRDGFVP